MAAFVEKNARFFNCLISLVLFCSQSLVKTHKMGENLLNSVSYTLEKKISVTAKRTQQWTFSEGNQTVKLRFKPSLQGDKES